jgi:hypothetical protein
MRSGDVGAEMSRRAWLRAAGAGVAVSAMARAGFGASLPDETGEGESAPSRTEFTFAATVTIGAAVEVGAAPTGERRYIPITGGSFAGPKIKGVVLPGGADWQLQRRDGVLEVHALYSIKAHDGAVIIVRNDGLLADGGKYFRTMPRFQAPAGPHDWLNKSIFVGSVVGASTPGAVVVRMFRVV